MLKRVPTLTLDALKKGQEFKPNRSAETQFYKSLRKVARASGNLIESHIHGTTIENEAQLLKQLTEYSKRLGPWAQRQSAKMLQAVSKKNRKAYQKKSQVMGAELKLGMAESHVDMVVNALMAEQVGLIKSIPLEAAQRAQALSIEAVYNGTRADEIAKELMRTTEVTESRAQLIAVTETARANASITQARATAIGADGYFWRTTMDGAERHSHALMNGKYVEYAKTPTLSDGTKGHAGTFPRCRCWQDVVFK